MSTKLQDLPFQITGIWRLADRHDGRCILADDIGLGKTRQSARASQFYLHGRPGIVICPAAVKWGWEVEIRKHLGFDAWVCEGKTPPKSMPTHLPPFVIINWEILHYWVDALRALKPNVVIPDEIHYGKSREALRTKALVKLCKDVPFIFPLSGTPIENGPIEYFPILNILWPQEFPSFRQFGMRYCAPTFTKWGVKYTGATHTRELNRRLKKLGMVRRLRTDVMKDLPPLQRVTIDVKLKNMKEYREAESNIIRWLHKHKPNKAHKLKNSAAMAMVRLNYLLQMVAEQKLPAVFEWIDNFLATSTEKICVYGHHRKFLEAIHTHYPESVICYGGQTKKKRKNAIGTFVNDPKCRIFVGSILAVGTGINDLQLVCSKMLIAELVWVGVKLLQLEGRLWRIGQKNPVMVYYMLVKNTVEKLLAQAIWTKQGNFNKVVDGNFSDKQQFDIFQAVVKNLGK